MTQPILSVQGLSASYRTQTNPVQAVRNIDFSLEAGETLAIVGESGCGKSTLARALLGVLGNPGQVTAGTVKVASHPSIDLAAAPPNDWKYLRKRIGWIVQDPFQALNPTRTIGSQLLETFAHHRQRSQKSAHADCADLLRRLEFHDPERIFAAYPFQLSGGMCQRIVMALALIAQPSILIADEPTTALDTRVQQRILLLLKEIQHQSNTALLLISHDLGVVAELAHRIAVMYAGQIVESGPASEILRAPKHPYTKALLACLPSAAAQLPQPLAGQPPALDPPPSQCAFLQRCHYATPTCQQPPPLAGESWQVACWHQEAQPIPQTATPATVSILAQRSQQAALGDVLLEIRNLSVAHVSRRWFGKREQPILRNLSLTVRAGEAVGLVGESGSGKTTLARSILRFIPLRHGQITLDGVDITTLRGTALRSLRRHLQPIFQDPRGTLNPRRSIIELVAEPLHYFRLGAVHDRQHQAADMLERVGIDRSLHQRKPALLSTGQCQRVAIARALVCRPKVLICDEPISALDISVQAQILHVFAELQAQFQFGMVFISHNIRAIQAITHRIIVLHQGRICDTAETHTLETEPRHPHTRSLLDAIPVFSGSRIS